MNYSVSISQVSQYLCFVSHFLPQALLPLYAWCQSVSQLTSVVLTAEDAVALL